MEYEAMAVWRMEWKVSILKEPNSCKRGQNLRKLLLGKLLSLYKLSLCDTVLHAENENEQFVKLSQYQLRVSKWIVRLHFFFYVNVNCRRPHKATRLNIWAPYYASTPDL